MKTWIVYRPCHALLLYIECLCLYAVLLMIHACFQPDIEASLFQCVMSMLLDAIHFHIPHPLDRATIIWP